MQTPPIDTLRNTETPEGVEVGLRLAGSPVRFASWLVDTLIRTAVLVPVGSVLAIFGNAGMGLFYLVAFFGEWFYPVVCEVYWNGQTPGKKLFGLKVVRDDGAAVDWTASTVRNMLRFADFLPAGFLFGFLSVLATEENKRLGDLAAGTVVIYADTDERSALSSLAALPNLSPAMPPLHLAQAEQAALIEFAERAPQWTEDRQIELADQLQPVTGELGPVGVKRLQSYALWLLGRR
ncbi:MAG: RDD family protein [Deltaproteobacteria bacterium]|nr:RDD family protein [Deltaproteobacteria bacterium]